MERARVRALLTRALASSGTRLAAGMAGLSAVGVGVVALAGDPDGLSLGALAPSPSGGLAGDAGAAPYTSTPPVWPLDPALGVAPAAGGAALAAAIPEPDSLSCLLVPFAVVAILRRAQRRRRPLAG